MARFNASDTAYKEGQYLIYRVEQLPPKGGANKFLYTVLSDNFSRFYKWLPQDGEWEVIDLVASIGNNTFVTSGTNVTVTGTGTSGDPYIISSQQDAQGTPINAIVGITSNNVQGALEELQTQVGNIDGSETIVQGAGDIQVTGSGTAGDPYIVDYSSMVQIPVLRTVKVTLTPAQILSLGTTPIQAVAAPGAGFAIEVFTANARIAFGSIAFDGGGDFDIACENASSSNSQYRFDPTFLQNTADNWVILQRKIDGSNSQIIENDALVIRSLDSTVGDSTVDVYITYRILEI